MLDQFESGKRELELVVINGDYCMRDIFFEFFRYPSYEEQGWKGGLFDDLGDSSMTR